MSSRVKVVGQGHFFLRVQEIYDFLLGSMVVRFHVRRLHVLVKTPFVMTTKGFYESYAIEKRIPYLHVTPSATTHFESSN